MEHFSEIIKYGFSGIKDAINSSYGNKHILLLAILALAYMAFFNRDLLKKIVIPVLLIAFIIFNPVLYYYVFSNIIYWRLLWMIPNVILISVAIADIIRKNENKVYKTALLVIVVLFIMSLGNNSYKDGGFWKNENIYKIPPDVIEISDAITEVDDKPHIIAAGNLLIYGRMYDGNITMPYGRDVIGAVAGVGYIIYSPQDRIDLYYRMIQDNPDYDFILDYASHKGYNFIVNDEDKPISDELLNRYGFELYKNVRGCNIYYNPKINEESCKGWQQDGIGFKYLEAGQPVLSCAKEINGAWYFFNQYGYCTSVMDRDTAQKITSDDIVITQYGDEDGGIGLFYTIDDQKGNFVVVDGGLPGRESAVRNVIQKYGNKVDYWIITHPHQDHMGAFDRICQDPQGMEIGRIYTTDVDREFFHQVAREWDEADEFDLFYSILDGMDNVTYVERGEIYSIGTKDIKVFNTFTDESYDIPTGSLPNASSMVFKISGNKTSMLFMGDVEAENAELMKNLFGDELKADYVQVAHHGQGIAKAYYEYLNPSIVFMDTPLWHRQTEGEDFPADHIAHFNDKGIKILTYDTAPNVIILK